MPPNMRSIIAQSCRNFVKEPKKRSTVVSVVARTLGCATGLFVGLKMQEPTDEATKALEERIERLVKEVGDISDRICELEEKTYLK